MKKFFVLILLVLVLGFMVSPVNAMIGGDPDKEHVNVGAIMMVWPQFDETIGRLCSGTLIHERALLTAAHCYKYVVNQDIKYDQMWVTFHQYPFNNDAEYLNVIDFIPHEDLNLLALDSHDIALVILAEPVVGITPAKLPDAGYMDIVIDQPNWRALDMIAIGYGITDLENFSPGDAQLDAERKSGSITIKNLTSFEIKNRQFAKPDNAFLSAGDSGGPLFHRVHKGNEVLVGLSSCVESNCSDRGIHYRLDTPSARNWVDAKLSELE